MVFISNGRQERVTLIRLVCSVIIIGRLWSSLSQLEFSLDKSVILIFNLIFKSNYSAITQEG